MVPLISVIVVTYNRARFLKEALESIKRQTFKDYEIILVDDGSTDNTREIAKEYPGIRYIYQEHSGISRARNTAVKAAIGKWIATLDSDDLWETDKLQKQVDYLLTHPDCRIVFTAFRNFTDIPEDKLERWQQNLLKNSINYYLPSALIDTGLFEEIGLYDESLEYGEDTDWTLRLKMYKVSIEHCVNETLYLRRIHASNVSKATKEFQYADMQKMAIDAYRKVRRLKRK